jgi:hypothetical protein
MTLAPRLVPTLVLVAAASLAGAAEDTRSLVIPTDLLEATEVAGMAESGFQVGKVTISAPGLEAEANSRAFGAFLGAGVGFGYGLQATAFCPLQFDSLTTINGRVTGTGQAVAMEQVANGFGDLDVSLDYRVVKQDRDQPTWLVGGTATAPIGNDAPGQGKVIQGNTVIQEGKTAGIGGGAWRYSIDTALSKRFGPVEPYASVSYRFEAGRTMNNVHEKLADSWDLAAGLAFHHSRDAVIDLRAGFQRTGNGTHEDTGAEVKEEASLNYSGQLGIYFGFGSGVTLMALTSVGYAPGHTINETSQMEMRNAAFYQFLLGVQVVLGGR